MQSNKNIDDNNSSINSVEIQSKVLEFILNVLKYFAINTFISKITNSIKYVPTVEKNLVKSKICFIIDYIVFCGKFKNK